MKLKWEENDIVPGQRVGSSKRSDQSIIGYDPAALTKTYALISLEDGMIYRTGSKADIADLLNATEDEPLELLQRLRYPSKARGD